MQTCFAVAGFGDRRKSTAPRKKVAHMLQKKKKNY